MRRLSLFAAPFLASLLAAAPALADDGTGNEPCSAHPDGIPACEVPADALLPDLFTVVPKHLGIQNQ